MADASSPPRPDSVPEQARWDPDPSDPGFEWVLGEVDQDGERHGRYKFWNREGVLHGTCTYVHGKIEGVNENYHPDGSISSRGEWRDGVLYDCDYFRAECESPEPWPAQAGDEVREVRYLSTDGKANDSIQYFDEHGEQVGMDGEPLPPRPEALPETARWFPDLGRWVDGRIERGTNRQIGTWKWWNVDGELQRAEEHDDQGRVRELLEYENGRLDSRSVYDANEVRLHYSSYFDDGQLFVERKKNADGKEIHEAFYTREGELREQTDTEWEGERIVKRRELGRGGELRFEAEQDPDGAGRLLCSLYFESGEPSARGALEGERIAGTWTFFDERGQPRRSLDMDPYELESEPTRERLP
ncbi:MAG: hypothetical protein JXR96_00115 [Deltaproteobacteria bacterium]|nr:hypothetical protein [Deltaproteobacteria bacterium]